MKIHKKFEAAWIVLCILTGFFSNLTVKADDISNNRDRKEIETKIVEQFTETETRALSTEIKSTELSTKDETETETESTELSTKDEMETEMESTELSTKDEIEIETESTELSTKDETETAAETEMTVNLNDSEELQTKEAEEVSEAESQIVDETPNFEAYLEYTPQGWIVKGVFKDFAKDTILVKPMCSTDGKNYQECGQAWNLQWLDSEEEAEQKALQNQRCLYGSEEPLKSYLAKETNCFYIKLRIVREGGICDETQPAMIARGEQRPVTEELNIAAKFASNVFVREGRPPNLQCYGRYQITVSEEASEKEISAFLPDTLPVEVQLQKGAEYIGDDIIDCPVQWKPLRFSQLTAGACVTVLDAAEEIVVPAGVILKTQTGIYQTEEPITFMDEVRLVFNVVAKDSQPTGVLTAQNYGLEMAFHLKPTGAVSIRAYTLMEGETKWVELPKRSLIDAVNAQPSTANSGYTLILETTQEPYLSYEKAQKAGEKPTPFLVGFKIEGGVYDKKQLVLAWPDIYELPFNLPKMGGSGGNEANAGASNKGDSTEGGQRPGLSQNPESGSTPESSEEPEQKLSDFELPKEPVKEVIPTIAKIEIPEDELSELCIESYEQQDMTHSADYKITASDMTETKKHIEDELPESAFDTMTSIEIERELSERTFSDTMVIAQEKILDKEYIQTNRQERPKRKRSSVGSREFFIIVACVIFLHLVCTVVSHKAIRVKILTALRLYFKKK